mgnify:CR=1 FL=1
MELVNFEEYHEDFTWDFKLHFPIPTLNYILNRMGWDVSKGGNEVEARGYVLAIIREARNYAYAKTNIINSNRIKVEYMMAHNVNYIYEMLEYCMTFLQLAYTSGDLQKFYEVINAPRFNVPAINHAIGSLSFLKNYTTPFKVAYEGF